MSPADIMPELLGLAIVGGLSLGFGIPAAIYLWRTRHWDR